MEELRKNSKLRRNLNKEFKQRVWMLHEPNQPTYFLFFDENGEEIKEVFYYTKEHRGKTELIVDRRYEEPSYKMKRVLYLN